MKKLMLLLMALALMWLMCLPALAETALPEAPDVEVAGYDWGYLGTIAGATAAVLLIVQYTKAGLDKLVKMPTRLYVYLLALIIMLGARWFAGGLTWPDVPLVLLNAVVVATSAMGAYDLTWGKAQGNPTDNGNQ